MKFKEPFKVYTAASNIEAHMIVDMLGTHGIDAFADEDNSGASLWAFGTLSQFHQPNVWIEKAAGAEAADLIRRFEETKRERKARPSSGRQINAECEDCGAISVFPDSLDGTTQECSQCRAYIDVGELDWDQDFGEPEE